MSNTNVQQAQTKVQNLTQVVSPKGQFSYPCLMKPKRNTLNNKEEYSVDILFTKDTDLSEIQNAINIALEKKFGTDKSKHPKKLKLPIKDGDEKGTPEYTGKFYITCKADASKGKIGVYDRQRKLLESESDVVGGDFGHVYLSFYGYDQQVNKGVSCSLGGVIVMDKTDEPFSGRANAFDAFESLAEDNFEEQNVEMFKEGK